MTKRIKLTIAYDGTGYSGWQIQKNALSIQEVLEKALQKITGESISITGASRTDAGVHALGNVAIFDTNARMAGERYAYALNTWLPEDIVCVGSMEVSSLFHPRFTSTIKTYTYDILNRRFTDPTRRLYTYLCWKKLDISAMQKAMAFFEGTHDFASFQASGSSDTKENTIRTIYHAGLSAQDDLIRLTFRGNGFLYHMVRILAGTLIEIGKGNLMPEDAGKILQMKKREAAGPTAPAQGLTLSEILYPLWDASFTRMLPEAAPDSSGTEN